VLQLALPSYRQDFLAEMQKISPGTVFYSGDCQFLPGVVVGVSGANLVRTGRNRFFLGRRFALQSTPWRKILKEDTVVVEGNPRVLNSWLLLLARRALSRRTLTWGHVGRRSGTDGIIGLARKFQRTLANGAIVYTALEKEQLRKQGYAKPVFVAHNAVNTAQEMHPAETRTDQVGTHYVFMGRLEPAKKPDLCIEAFARHATTNPGSRLVVIGSGTAEDDLRRLVHDRGIQDRVEFTGWLSDPERIRAYFKGAVALVCPGYIGLNAIQSLGYGVPVITGDNEPHAPEVTALDSRNSILAKSDDVSSFEHALDAVWQARHEYALDRTRMSDEVRASYSVEAMAQGFADAVDGL
jgi:glycosyltransferase involved in cell wall biosynthesis